MHKEIVKSHHSDEGEPGSKLTAMNIIMNQSAEIIS